MTGEDSRLRIAHIQVLEEWKEMKDLVRKEMSSEDGADRVAAELVVAAQIKMATIKLTSKKR